MNRTDIGKTTPRTHDDKWRPRLTFEKEKACILSSWIFQSLSLGVEVVECGSPFSHLVNQVIDCAHYSLRFYVTMIRQEIRHTAQGHILVVYTLVQRQNKLTKAFK